MPSDKRATTAASEKHPCESRKCKNNGSGKKKTRMKPGDQIQLGTKLKTTNKDAS